MNLRKPYAKFLPPSVVSKHGRWVAEVGDTVGLVPRDVRQVLRNGDHRREDGREGGDEHLRPHARTIESGAAKNSASSRPVEVSVPRLLMVKKSTVALRTSLWVGRRAEIAERIHRLAPPFG